MTKKIFAIMIALLFGFSMIFSASAYTEQYIYDPDMHLTDDELFELNSYAEEIEYESGFSVIFSIVSDCGGLSAGDYAEEIYYSFTDSDSAVVFVHNTQESVYGSYVSGDENGIFTDEILETMWNVYDSNESYFGGLSGFYASADSVLENFGYAAAPSLTDSPAVTEQNIETDEDFVPVERTLPLVVDNADIISEEMEAKLIADCEAILQEYQMEVAIVTVNDLEGKSAQDYADDFYDYNGYGYGENDDGILVLYKPGEEGNRELYITTHGMGSSVYTEDIRQNMFTQMKTYFVSDDCESAFTMFLLLAEDELKPGVDLIWLFVLMLVGAVVGLLIITSIISKNNTVVAQNNAKVYARQGSLVVTAAQDNFLYTHVDAVPKAKDNGSSSSTHTSSSGRTHSGTGGSF